MGVQAAETRNFGLLAQDGGLRFGYLAGSDWIISLFFHGGWRSSRIYFSIMAGCVGKICFGCVLGGSPAQHG